MGRSNLTYQIQSATLATSPKPESSRNYVGLFKVPASLAGQSEPPPMPSPSPQYALHFCHLAAQSQSREKNGGASKQIHLLALQSSPEKSIWHRLQIYLVSLEACLY